MTREVAILLVRLWIALTDGSGEPSLTSEQQDLLDSAAPLVGDEFTVHQLYEAGLADHAKHVAECNCYIARRERGEYRCDKCGCENREAASHQLSACGLETAHALYNQERVEVEKLERQMDEARGYVGRLHRDAASDEVRDVLSKVLWVLGGSQ